MNHRKNETIIEYAKVLLLRWIHIFSKAPYNESNPLYTTTIWKGYFNYKVYDYI